MNSSKMLILTDTRSQASCNQLESVLSEETDLPMVWKKVVFSAKEQTDELLAKAFSRHKPNLVVGVFSGVSFQKLDRFLERILSSGYPVLAVLDEALEANLASHRKRDRVDFVSPPLCAGDVLARLRRLMTNLGESAVDNAPPQGVLGRIVGKSPSLLVEVGKLQRLAACDARVLIWGETGTGKEVFARAIHHLSARSKKPFVPVNCGALPTSLLENELFGHDRGAYTSATTSQHGLVREAEGGTLFLDEIGCLPLIAQTKLLRLLQEKEYRPLGSTRTYQADIRIIAATHTDLEAAVVEGGFRQDLYYRLNIVPICLPPLRERNEDTPLLARHFLKKYRCEYGKPLLELTAGAMRKLSLYEWPGNVRELENVIERAVVLSKANAIDEDQIQLSKLGNSWQQETFKVAKTRVVQEFERIYLQKMLLVCEGNITQAALAAKKNRRAFWELIRKHDIDVDRFKP